MIFSHLVNYAHLNGLPVEPGFGIRRVRWVVDLDQAGGVRGVRAASSSARSLRCVGCPDLQQPEMLAMPMHLRARGIAAVQAAHFLIDTCSTVANWPSALKDAPKTADKHWVFKTLLRLASAEVESLKPLAAFLTDAQQLEAVRGSLRKLNARPVDLVTFAVDGQLVVQSDTWHAWWRQFRLELGSSGGSERGLSLITGQVVVPARTHPKIRALGVGSLSVGASVVSFHEQAFQSHGFRQGNHAPFHPNEAVAYQTALDTLLEDARRLGQLKVIHWYEGIIAGDQNPFLALFHPNSEGDEGFRERIRNLRLDPALASARTQRVTNTRFFSMTLTGAEGRARVKDVHVGDLRALALAVDAWLDDLELIDLAGLRNAPSFGLDELLNSLRPRRKGPRESSENYIAPLRALALPLWQAALNPGIAIPSTVAYHAINALRSAAATGDLDRAWSSSSKKPDPCLDRLRCQMALLKVFRRRRGDASLESGLNESHPSVAYQSGRLAAQLLQLQQWEDHARGQHRYQHRPFGLALTAPDTVLDPLIWKALRHLERLDATRPGLKPRVLKQLSSTWQTLGKSISKRFSLDDQVGFALGYYQQSAFDRAQRLEETHEEPTPDIPENS